MEMIVMWWVLFGIAAGIVVAAKSQNALGFLAGFLLGVLLGPIGLLIAFFVKPSNAKLMQGKRQCPHCKEAIHAEATVCPHCSRESWLKDGTTWITGRDGKTYRLDPTGKEWVAVDAEPPAKAGT